MAFPWREKWREKWNMLPYSGFSEGYPVDFLSCLTWSGNETVIVWMPGSHWKQGYLGVACYSIRGPIDEDCHGLAQSEEGALLMVSLTRVREKSGEYASGIPAFQRAAWRTGIYLSHQIWGTDVKLACSRCLGSTENKGKQGGSNCSVADRH